MLKRILQILLLCLAAIVLTTSIAFSAPLPSGTWIAEHTADHTELVTPSRNQPQVESTKSDTSDSAQTTNQPTVKPSSAETAAAKSTPLADPYNYDALREANREIYGEGK